MVPTADDPATGRACPVHQPRGRLRHDVLLGLGRLVRLLAGDAGVQHDRRDHDAARHQGDEHPLGQRASRAGHLRAARDRGVDVLACLERPLALDVGVA